MFFDLLFTEAQLGTTDDELLASVSEQTGIVSHAMLFLESPAVERSAGSRPPLPEGFANRFGLRINWASSERPVSKEFLDFSLPADPYVKRSPRIHSVTTDTEIDGVFRRMPVLMPYDKDWFPSLLLRAVIAGVPNSRIDGNRNELRVSGDGEGHLLKIPLDADGLLRLHYYERGHEPKSYSLAEILGAAAKLQSGAVSDPAQLAVNPLNFKDKLILVGGTAAGLEDLKNTPLGGNYPGVQLHATAISNILTQDFLRKAPASLQLAIVLVLLMGIYGCISLLDNVTLKLTLPVLVLLIYGAVALILFQRFGYWLDLARPVTLGTAAVFDGLAYMIFVEGRDKKKLKDTLSKYLPPAVTEKIMASGVDPMAEVGQRAELSILFSDIRGFTTLSEKMEPEKLVGILNQYLGAMTDVVFDQLGTLDKFIGDAVMAFWGAPVTDAQHAHRAIRCALKMSQVLGELNRGWKAQNLPEFQIGIGINTGDVIVGNIGSEKRLDYTVIGDNVNLSSRMEGLTKLYGVQILIGYRTEELTRADFVCRPIDFVKVKGKNQAVKIFEPLCETNSADANRRRAFAESFSDALAAFQEGKFVEARRAFDVLEASTSGGDPPSRVFSKRCQELLDDPPEAWDGVYVAKSK